MESERTDLVMCGFFRCFPQHDKRKPGRKKINPEKQAKRPDRRLRPTDQDVNARDQRAHTAEYHPAPILQARAHPQAQ